VRTSHRGNLAIEAIAEQAREQFGTVEVDRESVSTSYGAIARLTIRPEGRELVIDVTMNPKVPNDVASETIARYNRFLEGVTGFSAKERAKRLRKSASGPDSGT
jgi:hypothetical protein